MKSQRLASSSQQSTSPASDQSSSTGQSNSQAQAQLQGGGGAMSALDRARAAEPVSLDDYSLRATGQGEAALDTAGAEAANEQYSKTDLDEWERLFHGAAAARSAGTAVEGSRTEEEMLAAIKANTAPRFLARVGPKKNFGYGTFGRPNEFIFATEPADLIGCTPIEAMIKVGWAADDIKQHAAGLDIAVAVLDTSKALPNKDGPGTAQMEVGKFEWPDIKARATGDADLKKDFLDAVNADNAIPTYTAGDIDMLLPRLIDIASQLAVGAEPSAPTDKAMWGHLRDALKDSYGANRLYSGMGATVDENGNLGAREVMLSNNGTGFELTPENHRIIDLAPKFTAEDVDKALAPPPNAGH